MRIAWALFVVTIATTAGAVCTNWQAQGEFADVEAATVVFEGVVAKIVPGDVVTCADDQVVFEVERVWKGQPATRHIVFQWNGGHLTRTRPDGLIMARGCPMDVESDRFTTPGERLIVFAAGPIQRLVALGCGSSKRPTTVERKRLDKWAAKLTTGR